MEERGNLILKIWTYFSIILVSFVTFLIVVIMFAKANNADISTITFIGDPMAHYFYKGLFIVMITDSILIPVLVGVRVVLLRMFRGYNNQQYYSEQDYSEYSETEEK